MTEPRITSADCRIWRSWCQTARMHSRTLQHKRRVEQARGVVAEFLDRDPSAVVMWSGGKDSTAMAHLALSVSPGIELISEKDDLDYPGERKYVEELARHWGATLTVVEPEVSPAEWMRQHGGSLAPGDDIHGRAAALSKACFYCVVEAATAGRSVMLGLRSQESKGRTANRASRGLVYHASGRLVCQPIADWTGLDVIAYAVAHGIELLPLYRCVALQHSREPWRVRKSWWVQGAAGLQGGIQWIRHYYPSLYGKLVEWMPHAQSLGS